MSENIGYNWEPVKFTAFYYLFFLNLLINWLESNWLLGRTGHKWY